MKTYFFSLVFIFFLLGLFLLLPPSIASDPQRLLRTDLRQLELRIRTLEAEVRRLQQASSPSSPSSPRSATSPQMIEGELIGRSDPLMERFATLLIELKEQVQDLEKRVKNLEDKS